MNFDTLMEFTALR